MHLYFALNLFVLSVGAVEPEKASAESMPPQEQILILKATSAKDFSAEDVYRIELNLDIPGDIELIAMESEVIGVTLEKQTRATKTARDVLIQNYLENIALIGSTER